MTRDTRVKTRSGSLALQQDNPNTTREKIWDPVSLGEIVLRYGIDLRGTEILGRSRLARGTHDNEWKMCQACVE